MDRIRKVLDLARQSRQAQSTPEGSMVRPARPAESRQTEHAATPPTRIEYTTTRSFAPSPTVMEAHRILHAGADGAAAASFRRLRTQVLQRLEENGWRSLAVLGPRGEEGRTTTAINLAIQLANDLRHTVLLVDFDLHTPRVANLLGLSPEHGVDDLLRGSAEVADCLYHPQSVDRLVILPARGPLEHPSEQIAGPRGRALVAELRTRYPDRILLFDLPPVLGPDDALAFAPLVECGLLVVAEGATARQDVVRSLELLRRMPIIGTVLNRAGGINGAD